MSTVINLFGGSGLGKSTTAALLFGEMKLQGLHCEYETFLKQIRVIYEHINISRF